ncbi:MAG: crossover junction endodeoxyribonuclease RuvC [Acutalibacteraceae bacterium]
MIILGVDPGYATIGWGVVKYEGSSFTVIDYGAVITPPKIEFDKRLEMIFDEMSEIMQKYRPEAMSIEQLFFNKNTTTAIGVAEARGCVLLAARKNLVDIFEYTPIQVKNAVTGYGKAVKNQVMEMTKVILCLKEIPKPDDTADALALAICHAHSRGSLMSKIMDL